MKFLVPAFLLLLTSSCAHYYAARSDTDRLVDGWLAEHRYAQALDTLSVLSPNHPSYTKLRAREADIRRAAAAYEASIIEQADALGRQGRWREAEKLYAQALDRLPPSDTLSSAHENFQSQRAAHLEQLELQLLNTRAQRLLEELPLREEVSRTMPRDRSARRALEAHRAEADKIAQTLAEHGARALGRGQLRLAEQTLGLAQSLRPNDTVRELLEWVQHATAAQQAMAEREQRQRERQKDEQRRRRTEQLLADFHQAIANDELSEAREILDKLQTLAPGRADIQARQETLEASIARRVAAGIEAGRALYTRGEFKQALQIWESLLPLAPDNAELQGHIARAQRVVEKIRELSEKKPTAAAGG